MARLQKKPVSSGTLSTAAQKRGATALPTGSIAIRPSAVIWSVARIRPSSAAIERAGAADEQQGGQHRAEFAVQPRPSMALTWLEAP